MSASDFPFLSSISRHMCIVLFMTASAKSSILVCTRVETAVLFLLFFFHIFFHTQFSYVTIGTIVYIIALQCSSMLHCNSLRRIPTCKPCFESVASVDVDDEVKTVTEYTQWVADSYVMADSYSLYRASSHYHTITRVYFHFKIIPRVNV